MNGHKLVKDHPHHFEVRHPDGSSFSVAKSGLSLPMLAQIAKMPKHLAEGTPDGPIGTPDGPIGAPPPPDDEGDGEAAPEISMASAPPPDNAAPTDNAPAQVGSFPQPGSGTPGESYGVLASDANQGPPVDNPNLTPPGGMQQTGYQQPGGGSGAFQDLYGKAFGEMEAGIKGKAGAEAAGAKDQAKAYQDFVDSTNKAAAAKDKAIAENEAQHKEITDSIMNQKIDPNRIWNNTSTAGKIAAGIGILLSGIGSGLTGQQNLALKTINDGIDRDVDAQKAELGKKQTLLSDNLRKYGNIQTAYAATQSQLHSVAMAQIGAAAAKSQSGVAAANAKIALGQLDMQRGQLNYQIMQSQVGQQLGAGAFSNTSLNLENPMLAPYRDRAVQLGPSPTRPGGGIVLAKTKEDAPKVQQTLTSLDTIDTQLDGMLRLMTDNGRTIPGSTANKTAQSAKDSMILEMGKLHDVNRLNERELDIFKDLVPDPGAWRQDKAMAQVMQLKKLITDKRNAEFANHTEGFSPGAAAARIQQAPPLSVGSGFSLTGGQR